MTLPRPDRLTLLLAVIGVLGAVLVLLRTATWGARIAVDAARLVSTAHSLLAGDGFVAHDGASSAAIAMPGLPLALALIGLFGPDPLDSVGYLHAAAFGLTVFATALWVRSRTRSGFLAVWASLACAFSPPLSGLFSSALTEPLFICFTTLSLFALDRCLAADGRRSLLLAAAVCAALACATRHMGVALVAGAVPLLLLSDRRASSARLFWGGGVVDISRRLPPPIRRRATIVREAPRTPRSSPPSRWPPSARGCCTTSRRRGQRLTASLRRAGTRRRPCTA